VLTIEQVCDEPGVALKVLPDSRLLCSRAGFAAWARGRRELRMEHSRRWMCRGHHVLLDGAGEPEGGRRISDADGRSASAKTGPSESRGQSASGPT
jgi:deoxyribodipyrimidine photolyase-related protein